MNKIITLILLCLGVSNSGIGQAIGFHANTTNTIIDIGDTVEVDITTTNFDEMLYFQYTMEWNASVMELISVVDCNSNISLNCTLGTANFNETDPGVLRVSWFDANVQGKSLSDTLVYRMRFKALADGDHNLRFTDAGLEREAEGANGFFDNSTMVTTTSGTTTVGNGGSTGDISGDLTFNVGSATGNVDDEICVQVTTSGFDTVVYFQYTMEWDNSILELQSINNCNASLGLNCTLGATDFNETSPGVMRVSWLDAATLGIPLDDGSLLYELCFKLIGQGTSSIDFTSGGLGIEAETTEAQLDASDIVTNSGSITAVSNGNDAGPDALAFKLTDATDTVGAQVCIPVTVANFDSVIFFQYTMEWNATIMNLVSVDNCNGDIGLNCTLGATNFNETDPGVLRVSWLDAATVGKDLDDDVALFELCFDLLAEGSTSLAFTDSGLSIEAETVTDGTLSSNDITTVNSITTVTTTGDGGDGGGDAGGNDGGAGALAFNLMNFTDTVGAEVCVPVTVSNFDSVIFFQYTMEWDDNILGLLRVDNCNTDLGLNCNLGQTNFNETSPGVMRVSWLDAATIGKDLDDNIVLFELCFDLKAEGSTNVSFTSSGLGIEAETVADGTLSESDITTMNAVATVTAPGDGGGDNGGGDNGGGDAGGNDAGADALAFNLMNFTDTVGAEVCVPVTVANFDSVIFFQYTMEWDDNILGLLRVDNCNTDLGLNCNLGQTNFNETSPGVMRVSWLDAATVGKDLDDNAVLFELCFDLKAEGSTNVSFTGSGLSIEAETVEDGTLSETDITTMNAVATVTAPGDGGGDTGGGDTGGGDTGGGDTGGGTGGGNDAGAGALAFNTSDFTDTLGAEVCIPITVANFDEVIFFQYTMEWDDNILGLLRVDNCNTDLGLNCNLGQTNFNETSPGNLRVSWLDPATVGKTLDDDVVIFELCFDLKAEGTTNVSFTGSGLAIEAENAADGPLSEMDITTVNGVATVTAGGTGGGDTGGGDTGGGDTGGGTGGGNDAGAGALAFNTGDFTDTLGAEVCIPITVANFDEVIFFQYTMEWDDNILGLLRVDNCNTDLGLNCNLGQTNFNETSPGNLRVSWLDPATVGKTLDDDVVIFELCFDLKAEGTTNVSFTGSGLAIEAENAADGPLSEMDITTVNGVATVTAGGTGGGDTGGGDTGGGDTGGGDTGGGTGGGNDAGAGALAFNTSDFTDTLGAEVCIPITVANFDEVIFFQYTMEWDDNILGLLRVDNCNTDLGLNCNLGQTNFNETSPGNLRVSWLDPATVGKTLDDDVVIFELCFDLKAEGTTNVSFTGSGLAIEAENAADGPLSEMDITTVNGVATVTAGGTGGGDTGGGDTGGGDTGGGDTGGGDTGGGDTGGMDALTFSVNNVVGEVGQEVCIPIMTSNFTDVLYFQYTMEWDDNIIELIGVDNCNPDLGLNCNLGQTNFNETTPGILRVSWLDAATVGKSVDDNAVLYELCFRLKSAGTSDIAITGNGLSIEAETVADGELSSNEITTIDGVATVSNPDNAGPEALTFNVNNLEGEVGQEVCIPIMTSNFDSVLFFQYTMEWDDSILELARIDNCNADLGLNCNLGQTNFNETTPGTLRVSWLDPATVGADLDDNTVLYELCFMLKAEGTSAISITGNELSIEAETVASGELASNDINTIDGIAIVSAASGGGGDNGGGNSGGVDALAFSVNNIIGEVGDEICVPIMTSNFDDVLFFQYTMEWDDSIIELVRIDNCNTDLGLNCNLGQTNFNETSPGNLRVSWLDPATTGISLDDNAVLYELCFSLKSEGVTGIDITGNELSIEAETVAAGEISGDQITTVNGMAMVNASSGGGDNGGGDNGGGDTGGGGTGGGNDAGVDALAFNVSDITDTVGVEVCVPVTVANFDSVIFFQYTMEWDASILGLVRVDNCNTDLGLNCNLGQTNFNETDPGVLRVSWLDQATVGKDLDDNTVLYELCFDLLAEGTTTVAFTGSGLGIEAETVASGAISANDITTTNGAVTVTAGTGGGDTGGGDNGGGDTGGGGTGGGNDAGVDALAFNVSDITDTVGVEVCVPVTVANFDSVIFFQYTMEWDASILGLVRVDNCNTDLGLNCNLGQTNFNETDPGVLRVSWLDQATVGKDLDDNTVLYELCFDLLAEGTTTVAFTGNGLGIEAETVASGAISANDITTTNGAVTVTAGTGGGDNGGGDNGGGGNDGGVEALAFNVSDITDTVGAEVCVPVTVANFDSVIFFQYTMEWDASILGLVRIDNCNTDLGLNCNLGQTNFNETDPGVLRVSWLDQATVGKDLDDNTVLYELCFDLLAEGTTTVAFTGSGLAIEAETVASGAISGNDITTTNGAVTVTAGTGGGDNGGGDNGGGGNDGGVDALAFNVSDITDTVGAEVCVPVTVANFDSVIFFQYTMEWDASILGLVRIDNCNTDLGLNCNLGQTNFNETDPGVLRVSWLDQATVGKDLDDNTVLYELCFDLLAEGTTTVAFTGSGLGIEAETVASGAISGNDITTTNGAVTVTAGTGGGDNGGGDNGGGGNDGGVDALAFNVSDITDTVGAEVCVPVTVANFDSVIFFQYTMEWDASILGLVRIDNCNTDLGLNCNLGQTNFNETDPGVLRVSWLDQATVGKDLDDNTVLYELCFDLLAEGTTSVAFTGSGLGIEAETVASGAISGNDITTTNGTAIVTAGSGGGGNNGGGQVDMLSFSVSNIVGEVGQEICVPVITNNFDSVIFFQYTMEWDDSILELVRIDNCNSDLGLNCNLGQTNFNETSPGALRVSWLDAATVGVDLDDNTVLYELCFRLKAAGVTPISFTGNELTIEAETVASGNISGDDINTTFGMANVSEPSGGGNVDALTFRASNLEGNVGQEICVPVSVANFDSVNAFQYTMEWDDSILELVRIDNCNSDLDLNCTLGQANFNSTAAGSLDVSWQNQGSTGIDLINNTVLYELCFMLKAEGTSGILFTGNSLPITAETEASGSISGNQINTTDGMATVNPGGGGNGGGNNAGEDALAFNVSNLVGEVGTEACVPVTTANFDGVLFFQYTMEWDDSILGLARIDNCNTDLGLNCNLGQTNFNETSPGNLRVSWLDPAATGKDLPDNTVLYELCFELKAEGSSNIAITGSGLSIEAETNAGGPMAGDDITTTNGFATVNPSSNTGTPDELKFTTTSANLDEGASTCLNVMVENFDNITSFQITQTWDADVLELTGVQACNSALTGLNCNLGNANFSLIGNNRIDISWTDDSGNGVTIPDTEALFELCFRAVGGPGTGSVIDYGTNVSATNSFGTLENSNISTQNAEVNINGTISPGNLTFTADGTTADVGDTVCLQITTENFNDIVFFQYTTEWDASVIELIDLQNCNAALGLNCNLGQTNFNQTSPGSMRVSWLDQATVGASIPDGSVLYELCFKVVGQPGENSLVRFTSNEISLEGEDANGPLNSSDIVTQNGFITINDDGGGSNNAPLVFNFEDGLGRQNDTVCVAITPENFDDIIHFQFNVEWNSAVLQFVEVMGCNAKLDGLDCQVGPQSTNFNLTSPELLRVSWFDPLTGGLDIPDDEPLFELCFKLVGNPGSSSAVRITDNELDIEASNPNGDIDINNIILNNGMINVVAVMPIQQIDDIRTTDILCADASTGAIDIDVSGGIEPLSYSWNNGATTQDLTDVPAGTYKVTITDAESRAIVSEDIRLFEPAPMVLTNVQITDFNAEDNVRGAIDITLSGGTGPFTFLWSNGATSEDISSLDPGCYTIVITDRNNCQFTSGQICVEEEIRALSSLSATTDDVVCPTDGNGSISFSFNGGTAPFTFALSNGLSATSSDRSGSFDNLVVGDYTLSVTDAMNATIDANISIDFTSTFFVEGGVISTYNGFGVSGNGRTDATITATPNGSVGPYTYEWSDNLGNAPIVANVGAGTYTVTITDGNGCVAMTSITVTEPELLEANASANLMPGCNSICEGEASVNVEGGVAPFSFLWSTGSTQATIFDLCAGDYSVTVTDANSIMTSSSISIVEPDTLSLSFQSSAPSTINGSDGSAEVFVMGGTAPYTYQWNDSNGSATAAIDGLVPDVYFVIVTDANGCQKVASVEITNPIADCFETRSILTLDDDGMNESFLIQCVEQYQTKLHIFNRWGQLVFEATNYDNTWEGTDRRGNKLPEGGYFFVLKVTQSTGEITERKGHITIIRAE